MLTKTRIDRFYVDLKALGLKRPVADISKATGYSKGNISEWVNKKKEPSENFLDKFYEVFYKGSDRNEGKRKVGVTPDPREVVLTGAAPTLQDYIAELKDSRDKWYNLANSMLTQIAQDTSAALAYQKAWVEYEAQRASAGDEIAKMDLMHKMNTLVRGYLLGRSSVHNEKHSGTQGKG